MLMGSDIVELASLHQFQSSCSDFFVDTFYMTLGDGITMHCVCVCIFDPLYLETSSRNVVSHRGFGHVSLFVTFAGHSS